MDFQHYASRETSALLAQLLANHTGPAAQQLHALRDALDAVARALTVPPEIDPHAHDLAARLSAAAENDLRQVRENAEAAVAAARGELRAQAAEHDRLTSALAKTEAELALLRSELQTSQERAHAAESDLAMAGQARVALEHQVRQLEAEWTTAAQARAGVEGDLSQAHATVEQLLAEVENLRARMDDQVRHIARLEAESASGRHADQQRQEVVQQLDATVARIRDLEAEIAAAHEVREQRDVLAAELATMNSRFQTLERDLAGARAALSERSTAEASASADTGADPQQVDILRAEVDRLVSLLDASARAVTEMAAAATSGDLLTELVKRLSLQFSRVILFRVKGNRLEGEQQIGFDDTNVAKLAFPITMDSILSRAVASGTVESLTGDDVTARTGTPFGGAPTAAVALPIVLQGSTIAAIYADDSEMPEWARGPAVHESSVGFAKLLVGQAVVLLMRHTHELKTLAELRQYATTLIQEAREMYLADVEAGKSGDLLRSRLKDNLECASQLYAYRAAMEGTAAAALLDEQIVLELEESTPFARDLAAVISEMSNGDLQITAEAS